MWPFYRKYARTIADVSLLALTVYALMLAFSFLYRIAAPIFFALVVFAAIEPLAAFLHRRGVRKTLASAIATLVFVLVVVGLVAGTAAVFAVQLNRLAERIPAAAAMLQTEVALWTERLQTRLDALPPGIVEQVETMSADLAGWAGTLGSRFLKWIVSAVSGLSTFFAHFAIGVMLAYFLSAEFDGWKKAFREKTPRTVRVAFAFLRDNVWKGIAGYLKAQLKLVAVTFAVIFVSLLLLGVDSAFSISVLAAVFDLLPVVGVSVIFVPWILYLLVVGDVGLAVSLTVVLAVVLVLRQVLEPKWMGQSLGVSAFTMLSFAVVSASLFGVAGLVLSPVLLILLKALYDHGYLRKWIRFPKDEFDEPTPPAAPD